MTHLLVTNDFPPKQGGIGGYLYELWRRLPPERFTVMAIGHSDASAFDADQPFRIVRRPVKMLIPTAGLRRDIVALADEIGATAIVLDPAFPLGVLGPKLDRPYGVVLHGSEVTVPARLPASATALRRTLEGASLVVAAGEYPLREARRLLGHDIAAGIVIPPSVDASRFHPVSDDERAASRRHFGLDEDELVVVSVSRLVPRKGFDVLIEAVHRLAREGIVCRVAISGAGRDSPRLLRLADRLGTPVRFLGAVTDAELPQLYATADVFSMLCRTRWLGLEQEGFGIVFVEAGACGVPAVAGRSGGSEDAVVDEATGLVVDRPGDVVVATDALRRLLSDAGLRRRLGDAARERVVSELDPALLARRLDDALVSLEG